MEDLLTDFRLELILVVFTATDQLSANLPHDLALRLEYLQWHDKLHVPLLMPPVVAGHSISEHLLSLLVADNQLQQLFVALLTPRVAFQGFKNLAELQVRDVSHLVFMEHRDYRIRCQVTLELDVAVEEGRNKTVQGILEL